MIWYHDNGNVGIMIVLHVDDVMVPYDVSGLTRRIVQKLYEKYKFGEWVCVSKQKDGVMYTGRNVKVVSEGVCVSHNKTSFKDE